MGNHLDRLMVGIHLLAVGGFIARGLEIGDSGGFNVEFVKLDL